MKLETFSYLPELTAEQLERQISAMVGQDLVVGIEFSSAPDPRDHYWTMWKLPMFGTTSTATVLAELEACQLANPDAYIKLNGYDAVRQGQVVSFVARRPERRI